MKGAASRLFSAGHELLEHTADMGIAARAYSREELFVEMAKGLASLIFGITTACAKEQRRIQLTADDDVELLIAWLNEILYLCEAQRLVPADFRILSATDKTLEAVLFGEVFDPARHVIERQAKAVTYHQAQLLETPQGWTARVYVDL